MVTPDITNPALVEPLRINLMTGGNSGAMMPQAQYLTPPEYGIYRTAPTPNIGVPEHVGYLNSYLTANRGRIPFIPEWIPYFGSYNSVYGVNTFRPEVDPRLDQMYAARRWNDANFNASNMGLAFTGQFLAGTALGAIGSGIGAAALGGGIGGPVGGFIGGIGGGMLGTSLGAAAAAPFTVMLANELSEKLNRVREIQNLSMSKIATGPDTGAFGYGFSAAAARRIGRGLEEMAVSDPIMKADDYRKLYEAASQSGILDFKNTASGHLQQMREIRDGLHNMMRVLGSSDVRDVTNNIARLMSLGAEYKDISGKLTTNEQMAQRALGINHDQLTRTVSQPGALLYTQTGLNPYQGAYENQSNIANVRLAQQQGLIDPATLARFGGVYGMGTKISEMSAISLQHMRDQMLPFLMSSGAKDLNSAFNGQGMFQNMLNGQMNMAADPMAIMRMKTEGEEYFKKLSKDVDPNTMTMLRAIELGKTAMPGLKGRAAALYGLHLDTGASFEQANMFIDNYMRQDEIIRQREKTEKLAREAIDEEALLAGSPHQKFYRRIRQSWQDFVNLAGGRPLDEQIRKSDVNDAKAMRGGSAVENGLASHLQKYEDEETSTKPQLVSPSLTRMDGRGFNNLMDLYTIDWSKASMSAAQRADMDKRFVRTIKAESKMTTLKDNNTVTPLRDSVDDVYYGGYQVDSTRMFNLLNTGKDASGRSYADILNSSGIVRVDEFKSANAALRSALKDKKISIAAINRTPELATVHKAYKYLHENSDFDDVLQHDKVMEDFQEKFKAMRGYDTSGYFTEAFNNSEAFRQMSFSIINQLGSGKLQHWVTKFSGGLEKEFGGSKEAMLADLKAGGTRAPKALIHAWRGNNKSGGRWNENERGSEAYSWVHGGFADVTNTEHANSTSIDNGLTPDTGNLLAQGMFGKDFDSKGLDPNSPLGALLGGSGHAPSRYNLEAGHVSVDGDPHPKYIECSATVNRLLYKGMVAANRTRANTYSQKDIDFFHSNPVTRDQRKYLDNPENGHRKFTKAEDVDADIAASKDTGANYILELVNHKDGSGHTAIASQVAGGDLVIVHSGSSAYPKGDRPYGFTKTEPVPGPQVMPKGTTVADFEKYFGGKLKLHGAYRLDNNAGGSIVRGATYSQDENEVQQYYDQTKAEVEKINAGQRRSVVDEIENNTTVTIDNSKIRAQLGLAGWFNDKARQVGSFIGEKLGWLFGENQDIGVKPKNENFNIQKSSILDEPREFIADIYDQKRNSLTYREATQSRIAFSLADTMVKDRSAYTDVANYLGISDTEFRDAAPKIFTRESTTAADLMGDKPTANLLKVVSEARRAKTGESVESANKYAAELLQDPYNLANTRAMVYASMVQTPDLYKEEYAALSEVMHKAEVNRNEKVDLKLAQRVYGSSATGSGYFTSVLDPSTNSYSQENRDFITGAALADVRYQKLPAIAMYGAYAPMLTDKVNKGEMSASEANKIRDDIQRDAYKWFSFVGSSNPNADAYQLAHNGMSGTEILERAHLATKENEDKNRVTTALIDRMNAHATQSNKGSANWYKAYYENMRNSGMWNHSASPELGADAHMLNRQRLREVFAKAGLPASPVEEMRKIRADQASTDNKKKEAADKKLQRLETQFKQQFGDDRGEAAFRQLATISKKDLDNKKFDEGHLTRVLFDRESGGPASPKGPQPAKVPGSQGSSSDGQKPLQQQAAEARARVRTEVGGGNTADIITWVIEKSKLNDLPRIITKVDSTLDRVDHTLKRLNK